MKAALLLLASAVSLLVAAQRAERRVDPTFLHRYVPSLAEQPADLAGTGVHYRAVFGAGDPDAGIARGLARYGELVVDAGGSTASVSRPDEEQAWFVVDGSATLRYSDGDHGIRRNDFLYIPAGVKHGVVNQSDKPCRIIVMGFRLRGEPGPPPPRLLVANLDDVRKQVVGGHPTSTLYQLMMGDRRSTRDVIAAGHVLTSLYMMEFAPGGTNFPHHHETEEEAYLVLEGQGEMVAGGGVDGIEGRHPAKAGDAYFFRLNCTVGFYNSSGSGKAHILAVRWLYQIGRAHV